MDRNLALLLYFAICVLGPCWVFAACGKSSIGALGRNPSSAPKIFTAMIIILAFAEATAIIAMLIAFQKF
ncbi:MAG: ATP synthase F0 subunit C [Candidatus Omnitrophica bacterium]|nr:ATP synthase F0 subunit C [Candidatus Omnitrophota bacterium]